MSGGDRGIIGRDRPGWSTRPGGARRPGRNPSDPVAPQWDVSSLPDPRFYKGDGRRVKRARAW